MTEYRIEWVSLITNCKDHGSWFNESDKKMLEENIISYNNEYRNRIHHTIAQR